MKSFRTPRYLERYEDVVFDLENRLEINPNDTQHQNRDGLKFLQGIVEKPLHLIGMGLVMEKLME